MPKMMSELIDEAIAVAGFPTRKVPGNWNFWWCREHPASALAEALCDALEKTGPLYHDGTVFFRAADSGECGIDVLFDVRMANEVEVPE